MSRFTDESLYPEERGEIYGDVNEEEACFYFSLNDFESIVNKYGAHFVLTRMRNEVFDKLNEWFAEAYDTTKKEKEKCYLTSTRKPLNGSAPPF